MIPRDLRPPALRATVISFGFASLPTHPGMVSFGIMSVWRAAPSPELLCAEQVPRVTARRGELSVFDLSVAEKPICSSAPVSRPRSELERAGPELSTGAAFESLPSLNS